MSFHGLAQGYDFSTLPKVVTHAQLGRLGDPAGCQIWNPASWPTCSTWLIQARTELADAHNALIALTNAWDIGIADILTWPDSEEKSSQLMDAQAGRDDAYQLVQQHSQIQSEYEAKIQPWKNIGLAGLGRVERVRGLGIGPAAIWLAVGITTLTVSALAAWQITNALAMKAGYEANTAAYNAQAEYNRTCGDLLKQGKSCSSLEKPGAPTTPWAANLSTVMGLAAMAAIAFFFITTPRGGR